MKHFTLVIFLLGLNVLCVKLKAQSSDTTLPWDYSGSFQVNMQQLSLHNWQGGGDNTLAVGGTTELNANYIKGKHLWTNRLNAALGSVRQGDNRQPFHKSDDNLKFNSKYSYELHKPWSAVALADFQTYILPGYQYTKDSTDVLRRGALMSSFLSPAYLISAIGLEYKPSNIFYAMLAPLSTKFTIVKNDSMAALGAYGVDPGKNFRAEFGATFKSLLKWEFMKNTELQNELSLFGNYKNLKAIDVTEQIQLILKANKYLSATVTANALYDQDVDVLRQDGTKGPALQLKESILVGLQYSF